jgi:hypothetical protein
MKMQEISYKYKNLMDSDKESATCIIMQYDFTTIEEDVMISLSM